MLNPEEFAILPWGWIPAEQTGSASAEERGFSYPGFKDLLGGIKECGFNLAGFVPPEHLDAVAAAGLKGIVIDRSTSVGDAEAALDEKEIAERVGALVKRVGGHEAAFGYFLRDEPGAALFPGLRKWVAAYERAAPGKLLYLNLFPYYPDADCPCVLNVPTYEEYLESFVRVVRPKFISYDHYALKADGSMKPFYFKNLELVRAAALRHDLFFWNIVLANAHFDYAEPSDAWLRFQAFTTLAYGARGISYFTYFAPDLGNYRLAAVDQFGHKTPTWDMLRNVNLQIHALGPTYVTLKSANVFHHPEIPQGCRGLDSSRWLSSLAGGNLMAGEFEDPAGRPFVLVVNKSLRESAKFSVQFREPGELWQINAYTGRAHRFHREDEWLAPGQGMLLFEVRP